MQRFTKEVWREEVHDYSNSNVSITSTRKMIETQLKKANSEVGYALLCISPYCYPIKGIMVPKRTYCNIIGYTNSNFARCRLDRKSTCSTCHLIGKSLVSRHSKKQESVVLSITGWKYIVIGSCCSQTIYMKHQIGEYDVNLRVVPIRCNNTGAISLAKNKILYSRAKHIEVMRQFISEHVKIGNSYLCFNLF